jgi:hypothetical protein
MTFLPLPKEIVENPIKNKFTKIFAQQFRQPETKILHTYTSAKNDEERKKNRCQ